MSCITSPAQGTTLTSRVATFQWTAVAGAEAYWLSVGNTVGGEQYYSQTQGVALQGTVSILPVNGSTLHVRLYTRKAGAWTSNDYTYTATGTAPTPTPIPNAKPQLTSPTPGSTLPGSVVTFQWTAGTGVEVYWLSAGSSVGGEQYYSQSQSTARSGTVRTLPTNGSTVHLRLYAKMGGVWQSTDYTYTAARDTSATPAPTVSPTPSPSGCAAVSCLTSPAPGSTLPGASVTFSWTAVSGALAYWLSAGSGVGGEQFYSATQGTALSGTLRTLPTNGSTVHLRLYTKVNTGWQSRDYTFTAAGGGVTPTPTPTPSPTGTPNPRPQITSPSPGSAVNWSAPVTFRWTAGTGVETYWLSIGSTAGGGQYYNQTQGTALEATLPRLPVSGGTVYVRLYAKLNGSWQHTDYTYGVVVAASAPAGPLMASIRGGAPAGGAAHVHTSPLASTVRGSRATKRSGRGCPRRQRR